MIFSTQSHETLPNLTKILERKLLLTLVASKQGTNLSAGDVISSLYIVLWPYIRGGPIY